ncbi:MAG: uracil phosphoribosyltransferase [bacterium]
MSVIVTDHPIISDCLARLRDRDTGPVEFRLYLKRAALALICEAVRGIPLKRVKISTPLSRGEGEMLAGRHMVAVPVLRAGLGMLGAFLELFPDAIVGMIGLRRNEKTFRPREYYHSLPDDLSRKITVILDPMLATGGSLLVAIALLKKKGARDIRVVTLVAAPEGVARVERRYPEVMVYTASIDSHLNKNAYIVPGIGDAGDRIFGTD